MAAVSFEFCANNRLFDRHYYLLGEDGTRSVKEARILVAGGPKSILQEITAKLLKVGFSKVTNSADTTSIRFSEANLEPGVIIVDNILEENLGILTRFNCVILAGHDLAKLKAVNRFCRQQSPKIKFINADVIGAFCWCFCDFGDDHQITDIDGEPMKEAFVSNILKGNPTVVSFHEDAKFSNGETVTFSNVGGMKQLNGSSHQIQVIDSTTVLIGDTSSDEEYQGGGVCHQIKLPIRVKHQSLEHQLSNPTIDAIDGKDCNVIYSAHLGLLALDRFKNEKGHFPHVNSETDFTNFMEIVKQENENNHLKCEIHEETFRKIARTSVWHEFVLLQNFTAAVVVQEVIKAVTYKFMPLNQWIFMDVFDLVPENNDWDVERCSFNILGKDLIYKLNNSKIFMVGCGAVGCEILRDLSMLGVATKGMFTVTDNGAVRTAHLNTHTMFCKSDILKPKSIVAANAFKTQYKDINITPHTNEVGQQLNEAVFEDEFFQEQDVIISAVDNDKSARWIDRRCVQNCRPLVDTRINGWKGNIQTIIPHYTQSLPNENIISFRVEQVPYCILKSFPVKKLHTIKWARDKFDNLFWCKPVQYQKFWELHGNASSVLERLEKEEFVDGAGFVAKFMEQKPGNWNDCVTVARLKFEKYFNHKAKQLLHNFPLDSQLENGHSFWQPPKQPPSPITFDPCNALHLDFIVSTAALLAQIWGLAHPKLSNLQAKELDDMFARIQIPEFSPNSEKVIETDETIKKPRMENMNAEPEETNTLLHVLRSKEKDCPRLQPVKYDKDDATLHLSFVESTSKLRAQMYGIDAPTTDVVQQFAGKITPAIATSAAIVASLAVLEVLRIMKPCDKKLHRNCYINSLQPCVSFTEPQIATAVLIRDNVSFTIWDTWTVHGHAAFTLQELVDSIKREKGVEITTVVQASKIVYMPFMPGHGKRLAKPMLELIDCPAAASYVELTIIIETCDGEVGGPAIRYYFNGPRAT